MIQFKQIFKQFKTKLERHKVLACILLVGLLLQLIYITPDNVLSLNASLRATASVFSDQKNKDLILILVDEVMYQSNTTYNTDFQNQYSNLRENNLKARIDRYAKDIQINYLNSNTPDNSVQNGLDTAIMPISSSLNPAEIASTLKQAYYQNLPEFENYNLKGLVLIGELPIPVVDKNGNRFVSLYPYTDFENPAFIWDPNLQFFVPSTERFPQPEIWHGVINMSEPQLVAEFFDKNHLHHSGEGDFSDFQTKIFFTEPHHDGNSFNQDLLRSYQTYMTLIEEFAYNRYSSKLFDVLSRNSSGLFQELTQLNQTANPQKGQFLDIFIKPAVENFITQVTDVFSVALRDQRDALIQTGRYTESDYVSGLIGIAKLDELSALYLKEVNQLIENELDQILKEVQLDLPLLNGSVLQPVIQFEDDNGELQTTNLDELVFVNHSRSGNVLDLYLGLIPGASQSFLGLPTDQVLDSLFGSNGLLDSENLLTMGDLKINGTPIDNINTAAQCRLFRGGGTNNILDKTVRTHRGLVSDRGSLESTTLQCHRPFSTQNPENNWVPVDAPANIFNRQNNILGCTTFSGENLQDFYRTEEVSLNFQSPLTHEACSGMRLSDDYISLLKAQYSNNLDNQSRINTLNSIPDYANLPLFEFQGQSYTLSQFIQNTPNYRSVNLNSNGGFDWHAFSSQILNNPVQKNFNITNPFGPNSNVKNVSFQVEQFPTGETIPSLLKHADPTPGIISNAFAANNPHLPINATRFATFIDKNGQKQELIYPNLFKVTSISALRQDLTRLEQALNSISPTNQSYSGRLTQLVNTTEDTYQNSRIITTNQTKVAFFLNWLNFDLNQKYQQVFQQLLNKDNTISFNNLPKNYEIAHITGNSMGESLSFNLLDFDLIESSNPITVDFQQQYERQIKQDTIALQTTESGIDLFTYFTEYLPSWYNQQLDNLSKPFTPQKPEFLNVNSLLNSDLTPTKISVSKINPISLVNNTISLQLNLLDKNDNQTQASQVINIESNLPQSILDEIDQISDQDGTQIQVLAGQAIINITPQISGTYQINFQTNNISQIFSLDVLQSPQIQVLSSSTSVSVDDDQGINLEVKLIDQGQEFVLPAPTLSYNRELLNIVYQGGNQGPLNSTIHRYQIIPKGKTANTEISFDLNQNLKANYNLEITPSIADKIKFISTSSTNLSSNDIQLLNFVIQDRFGNIVSNLNTNATIEYDDTAKLINPPTQVNITNGRGQIRLQSDPLSFGNVFLKLSLNQSNIQTFHRLNLGAQLNLDDQTSTQLNSLIFNIFTENSLFQSQSLSQVLSKSKVQAISTLTTNVTGLKPILYIHPSGGVEIVNSSDVLQSTQFSDQKFISTFTNKDSSLLSTLSIDTRDFRLNPENPSDISTLQLQVLNPDTVFENSILTFQGQNLIQFGPEGQILSLSPLLNLSLSNQVLYKVELSLGSQVLATLTIRPNALNQVLINPNALNPNFTYERGYTLNSSSAPKGLIFYNNKLNKTPDQLPNTPDTRSDDFLNQKLTGLKQGSKMLHLLASENTVGESNRNYLSEAGVVLGDPSIKLPYQSPKKLSNMNFSDSLGLTLDTRPNAIHTGIVHIPNTSKVAITYSDGLVSLYDSTTNQFIRNWISVPGGINSVYTAKLGSSSQYQLVFLTNQACLRDDSCIYVFNPHDQTKIGRVQPISPDANPDDGYSTSFDGISTLNSLELNLESKAKQLLFADLNQDGFDDLIVQSENQIMYLFWNESGKFNPNPFPLGHTRFSLGDLSIIDQTLISTASPTTSKLDILSDTGSVLTSLNFQSILSNQSLSQSTVRVQDINGGTLQNNDIIQYSVTLSNSSAQALNSLSLSIPIPLNQTLDINSLSPNTLTFNQTNDSASRRYIISNISIPATSSQQFTFQTRYNYPSNLSPAIIMLVPEDEQTLIPIQDKFLDLKVVVPNTDYILYLYSDFDSAQNKLTYRRLQVQQIPEVQLPNQGFIEQITNNLGNLNNLSESQQKTVADSLFTQTFNQDRNNNGINDSYEGSLSGGLESAGKSVENLIKGLSCGDGGCLAVPKNRALLVPGTVPGQELPAFAWGCPPTPPLFVPTWPPQPFQGCTGGRIYISPTFTGELAGSVCVGPHLAGVCYTFSITDLGDFCDSINQKVKDVINSAKTFAQSKSGGVITIGNSTDPNQSSNVQIPGFPEVLTSWVANQWEEIQDNLLNLPDINIIYPDPQSLIGYVTPNTNQSSRNYFFTDPYPQCTSIEIYTSSPQLCGNLPSYTDVLVAKQNAKSRADFNSIQDAKNILTEIAAMPLFDINYETVYVNYPWIDAKELTDYRFKLFELWEQIKQEVFIKGTRWGCFANTDYDSIVKIETAVQNKEFLQTITGVANQSAQFNQACIGLAAGFEGIHLNIQENLRVLQSYTDLPKNIIQTENYISDYADQILQYAEQILQTTLGWLTENTSALLQWEQAILELETLVADLQLLLKFSADFIETCDECRSNRTNDEITGLINLFASFAPELPVIEIPRFPDITLDVSHIQAGIDITIPDIQFKKDLITLPNLNLEFTLPDTPQSALGFDPNSMFPNALGFELYLKAFEIPVLPSPPDLSELNLIQSLPDLPTLELPILPSLPKPPSISNFTNSFTETIQPTIRILTSLTRIYCLISKGFVPMPESEIKGQIETMTNRPLAPVLPIDIGFKLPTPNLSESYVNEIIFKLITNLNLDFPQIQEFTEQLAAELNQSTSNISDAVESQLAENFQFLNFGSVNILGDELTETIEKTDLNLTIPLGYSIQDLNQQFLNLNTLSQQITNNIQPSGSLSLIPYPEAKVHLSSLSDYLNHFLVKTRQQQNTSRSLQANLNPQPLLIPEIKSFSSPLSSNLIAQAQTPGSSGFDSTFNPESGIYIVDENQNISRLISYQSPLQAESKVVMFDKDQDGDEDIIYTLEDSIYIKENKFINTASSRTPSNPIRFNFDQTQIPDSKTIQNSNFQFTFGHNFIALDIPPNLLSDTIIFDTYRFNLQTAEPYQRYIINPEGQNPPNLSGNFNKTISLSSQNTVRIPITNGAYIGRISLVDKSTQTINILQSNISLSPTNCGDLIGPVIISEDAFTVDVPLYGNYTLDLSKSYDSSTDIYEIYLDNNLQVDSDQDGDPTNDRNIQGSTNIASKVYKLGPFNQLETRQYQINMLDINNNKSTTRLTLRVVPPAINLTVQPDNTVQGQLDPISGGTPVTLVRQRNNVISKLADVVTDSAGSFQYKPETGSNSIIIRDINQQPLFEVNKDTGTILQLNSSTITQVSAWQENITNTSVSLIFNNQVLTKVQKISDAALTPIISNSSIFQDIQTQNIGVHLQDHQPSNNFRAKLDNNQILITNPSQQTIAVITSSGQISLLSDQVNLSLSNARNLNDLQTIDFFMDSTLQFSLFVNPANSIVIQDPISIATSRTRAYTPPPTPKPEFQDLPTGLSGDAILRLQELGIIEGIQRNGQVFFEPNREIFRSEYAKIVLEALCLEPSAQSYLAPAVFSDIPFSAENQEWFYSYTKETNLLGLFTGYLGEFDQSTGLYPFKPQNSITLAEATKVILEALQYKSVLDINPVLSPNQPWYIPYLQIAQNLQPHLTELGLQSSKLNQNQLLTAAEASNPNRFITREEFAILAGRVLDLYNCYELEPDFIRGGSSTDQNTGNNQSGDTTDPNNNLLEQTLVFPNPTRPGLYIDEIVCNTCPCAYTIDDKNGIIRGDIVFAVILGPRQEIYSQSNLVEVKL